MSNNPFEQYVNDFSSFDSATSSNAQPDHSVLESRTSTNSLQTHSPIQTTNHPITQQNTNTTPSVPQIQVDTFNTNDQYSDEPPQGPPPAYSEIDPNAHNPTYQRPSVAPPISSRPTPSLYIPNHNQTPLSPSSPISPRLPPRPKSPNLPPRPNNSVSRSSVYPGNSHVTYNNAPPLPRRS